LRPFFSKQKDGKLIIALEKENLERHLENLTPNSFAVGRSLAR